MIELTVLLVSITFILLFLYIKDNTKLSVATEGFENYYLNSCPSGYKSFYNNDGNIVCCDGDVIANRCLGDNQCTLNGKGSTDLPNCVDSVLSIYNEKGKSQCPPNMSQYYEDKSKQVKGCTQGRLNDTLSAPQFNNQPSCFIYDSWDKNVNLKDSCNNQKLLDAAQCFGNNCTKELVQPISSAPPLVAIGFTDNMGMHRVAYTKDSMETFLDVSNPNWRNQDIDLSKNINVAEVAKAFYIDRTIDQSEIQF
jgi:hypothetical protein